MLKITQNSAIMPKIEPKITKSQTKPAYFATPKSNKTIGNINLFI